MNRSWFGSRAGTRQTPNRLELVGVSGWLARAAGRRDRRGSRPCSRGCGFDRRRSPRSGPGSCRWLRLCQPASGPHRRCRPQEQRSQTFPSQVVSSVPVRLHGTSARSARWSCRSVGCRVETDCGLDCSDRVLSRSWDPSGELARRLLAGLRAIVPSRPSYSCRWNRFAELWYQSRGSWRLLPTPFRGRLCTSRCAS